MGSRCEYAFEALDESIRKNTPDGTFGGIRVKLLRKYMGFTKIDDVNVLTQKFDLHELQMVSEICKQWISEVEVLPIKLVFKDTMVYHAPDLNTTADIYCKFLDMKNIKHTRYKEHVFFDWESYEWIYKPTCKRGNFVYLRMIRDKLKPLHNWLKSDEAKKKLGFSTVINENRKRVRKGKLFLISCTDDHDKITTVGKSWITSGSRLNSYLSYLRQEFPDLEYFQAPQAQGNGYFHSHIVVYIPDPAVTVFPHKEYNKKKKKWDYVWRIHNRQKHNGKFILDIFKNGWTHGFVDVRAIDSPAKGFTEVLKYVTRDLSGGEYNLTMGALWFFGKKGYSHSKTFIKALTGQDNIDLAEPSNDDLIKDEVFIQSSNSKSNLIRMEIYPAVLASNLDFSYTKDIEDLEKKEDPPPKVLQYFWDLEQKCKPSSFKTNEFGVEVVVYKYEGV